jgi:hypothetical protein
MTDAPREESEAKALEKPFHMPLLAGFILHFLFCILAFLSFVAMAGQYPLLRAEESMILIGAAALPLFLLFLWFLVAFLKKKWRGHRPIGLKIADAFAFGFLPFVGFVFLTLASVLYVNGSRDTSDATSYKVMLASVDFNGEKGVEGCSVRFQSPVEAPFHLKGLGHGLVTLPIFCRSYMYLQPGLFVDLSAHAGLFGLPWVESYAFETVAGHPVGPKGPFWPYILGKIGIQIEPH